MWRCVALSGLHRGGGKRILQSRSTFPGADTAHTSPATATEAATIAAAATAVPTGAAAVATTLPADTGAAASTGTIRATPG